MSETNEIQETVKKKKKWLIPVIIAGAATMILAIVAAVVIFSVISVTAPKRKLQKQLDLGEKYLSDLDYENAILAYREAIRIDPKSEPAYLGLSHVYETMADNYHNQNDLDKAIENLDEAIDVLADGYNETSSEVIKDEKERIEKKKEEFEEEARTFEVIDISEAPEKEKLIGFLSSIGWWGENFDCNNPDILHDFVQFMLACDVLCDFSQYTDYLKEPYQDKDYDLHFDGAGLDWILSNIYNFGNQDLADFKNELSHTNEGGYTSSLYYSNGEYISPLGGIGGGNEARIKEVQTDGKQYRVIFDIYWDDFEDGMYYGSTNYALMEYKIIDGKGYWSVYKVSENDFFEDPVKKGGEIEKTEWESIYATVLEQNLKFIKNTGSGDSADQYVPGGIMEAVGWLDQEEILKNIGYVIMDINGDDIPELLIGEHGYPGTNEQNDIVWGGYSYYYGANGGEVVFFLDGWTRNQYMWIGNGLFYHEGSGSASSGSVGFARLFKDGSLLTWDDFYFFEGADVYHNNLGTYNVDQSTRATLSVEELFQLKDKYTFERLPFKPLNE